MITVSFQTSGTTGEPKTVSHTLEAMEANARAFNEAVGLGPHTRMYHCLPRTHMAGFLNTILCPTLAGGTVAFGPTFSAQTGFHFWDNLVGSEADTVWITPTMAAMLLTLNPKKLGIIYGTGNALRQVFCGTAPLPRRIRDEWLERFGIPLQESYGTSEHMLVSVQSKEDALTEHNVGRPIPGVDVEIRDNSEIFVNGTPTGDQGELKDGKLTITGRLKDLIKRGGVSVSPARIEEAYRKLRGVVDVAVVGQPDDFWGEKIVVFVEGSIRMQDALSITRSPPDPFLDLPKSHLPDRVEIVDKLPRNEMGKVRKGELLRILSE